MRSKKKKSHENHERWLVSYADFITLLFAFFVVLFASSQVDKKKLRALRPISRLTSRRAKRLSRRSAGRPETEGA